MKGNKTTGEVIRRWIKNSGQTQAEVAKQMGLTLGALAAMLCGQIALPQKRLQQLIELLQPSQEDIHGIIALDWRDPPPAARAALERIGREALASSENFWTEYAPIAAEVELDLRDTQTHELLLFWRDMSQAQRYLLLAKASEIQIKPAEDNSQTK